MKEFQEISIEKLTELFKTVSYWTRIHTGKLRAVVQKTAPAKIVDGGTSTIVTYYTEENRYLCTMHVVTTNENVVIHEHLKDACLYGIWYKCIQ